MANDFYTASGTPSQGSTGSSATMRAEFNAIVAAFDRMPALTGSAGRIVVVNAGATALSSSSALTISGSDVSVAGTTSFAGQTLAAAGSAAAPSYSFTGFSATGMFRNGSQNLGFSTNGVMRFTLDINGNAGLGNTPYPWGLGNVALDFGVLGAVRSDSATAEFSSNVYNDGTNPRYKANGFANRLYANSGIWTFDLAASGTAGNIATFSTKLSINQNGAVIIPDSGSNLPTSLTVGNTTNARNLAAIGDIQFSIGQQIGAGTREILVPGTSTFAIGTLGAGFVNFYTNTSARLSITSTGLVKSLAVGVSSAGDVSTSYLGLGGDKLLVVDSTRAANNREVEWNFSGGNYTCRFVNDAYTLANNAIQITGGQAAGVGPIDFFYGANNLGLRLTATGTLDYQVSGNLRINGNITRFESAEQTCPSTTTTISVATSGARKPDMVRVVLRCKTAELSYSVGDEVGMCDNIQDTSRSAVSFANASSAGVVFTGSGLTPSIRNASTGALAAVTAANWRVVIYCQWL